MPRIIKPAAYAVTVIELPDGSRKTVAELLRALEQAKSITRVNGVEYDTPCQCDGSIHEMGMGCW